MGEYKTINLVMPMGGSGSRFSGHGFDLPKPLLLLKDKPFFWWAVQSIYKYIECSNIIFVVLKEHVDKFQIDKNISAYYPNAKFVYLEEVLKGPVFTCLKGAEVIDNELPVIFNDCDHLFYAPGLYDYYKNGGLTYDGVLLTFKSSDPKFSYLEYNRNGFVKQTIEKQVISNDAICGAYCFKNREIFIKAAAEYTKTEDCNEYYMSGVYNTLISLGGKVKGINSDIHLSFGTPEEFLEAGKSEVFINL
jgi:dTDP-glucose pyrophosphorylase